MNRNLALVALIVLAVSAVEIAQLHFFKGLENRLLDSFVKRHAARRAPEPGDPGEHLHDDVLIEAG